MKIELIKLRFNNTNAYKYKSFKYCCQEFEENPCIKLTREDLVDFGGEYTDEDDFTIPQFCISQTRTVTCWEDEWEATNNYPIRFCPYCGEKITVDVVDEIDISKAYNKTVKLRKDLWEQHENTDSKSEAADLLKKVHKLDKKIDWFYESGECRNEEIYGE